MSAAKGELSDPPVLLIKMPKPIGLAILKLESTILKLSGPGFGELPPLPQPDGLGSPEQTIPFVKFPNSGFGKGGGEPTEKPVVRTVTAAVAVSLRLKENGVWPPVLTKPTDGGIVSVTVTSISFAPFVVATTVPQGPAPGFPLPPQTSSSQLS